MNIAVQIAKDVGSLSRALDTACAELDINLHRLDVPTRDRLVERILKMLSVPR